MVTVIFDYDWVQNKYPVVGLIVWYIFIFILGLATYPIMRLAMPGLADKGYLLSRALGLLIFGYIAWLASSVGIPHTRITIVVVFGVLLVVGAALAYYQREELREEWRTKRKYFLMAEGLFLAFFLIDYFIRLGTPIYGILPKPVSAQWISHISTRLSRVPSPPSSSPSWKRRRWPVEGRPATSTQRGARPVEPGAGG